MTNETIIKEMKFAYNVNISDKNLDIMLNKSRTEELDKKEVQVKAFKLLILAVCDNEDCECHEFRGILNSMDDIFDDCVDEPVPLKKKPTPIVKKAKEILSTFTIGEAVSFVSTDGSVVRGKITKIYETTFGAKVRDTALQLKLDKPRLGRVITTVRAKKCVSIKKSPFYGRICKICNEPAVARIFSKNGTTINDYYCRTCYAATRVLLPLNKKDDFQIKG